MKTLQVPATVSAANQTLFDNLKKAVGKVPNLYATFANSEHALGAYLGLQSFKSSLKAKEKELVNLVVSQVNDCDYCLSAHTAIGKMNGFTDEQVLEIRSGQASFDPKLDALAKLVKSIVENRGRATDETVQAFYAAGYTKENLVDTVVLVGDKTITNYLFSLSDIEIDWPAVPKLTK
jgi:AhpD family alkylhydroperoxidase